MLRTSTSKFILLLLNQSMERLPREVVDAKSIKTFKERLEANWEHKKTTFVIKIDS